MSVQEAAFFDHGPTDHHAHEDGRPRHGGPDTLSSAIVSCAASNFSQGNDFSRNKRYYNVSDNNLTRYTYVSLLRYFCYQALAAKMISLTAINTNTEYYS